MIDQTTRAALKADIAAHLLTNGGADWKKVQERYPAISAATFWRTLRQVKLEQPGPPENGDQVAPSEPSPPSPELDLALERMPWLQSGFTKARVFEEHDRFLRDVEKLRAYSVDEFENVVRPASFLQSIKLRERALSALREALSEMSEWNSWEASWGVLAGFILEQDEDTARKLAAALREYVPRNHEAAKRRLQASGADTPASRTNPVGSHST